MISNTLRAKVLCLEHSLISIGMYSTSFSRLEFIFFYFYDCLKYAAIAIPKALRGLFSFMNIHNIMRQTNATQMECCADTKIPLIRSQALPF